jgi:carboxyl-terminal processing protease
VPKFSDGEVHAFKTANGRTVYDGGGVLPDVVLDKSVKTEETKTLLRSKAIFNYATDYYYKYPNKENITSFNFKDSDFLDFISYLKTDTTFVTKQEKMFDDAYKLAKLKSVSKEFDKIKDKLYLSKIDKIKDNKDVIEALIKEEIIKRYTYQEGVYSNKLETDNIIKEAVRLLKDSNKYKSLLFVK